MIRLRMEQEIAVGLAILAGARTSRGNAFRNSQQDRGSDQNIVNDLAGVIGEWAAIHTAEVAGLRPKHRFFDTSGPVKEADLFIDDKGLDAKAVALDPSRKCLIVDARAAAAAADKGITAIVPVLMQQGSAMVAVGRRIPMATVLEWESRQFRPNTPAAFFIELKQLASQEALNKFKAMGVTPTSETDPIQLEAVRLNLLKEQNLAQKAMYDQLLANYNAAERMNIAAQRYADILMVIADSKISEQEVNLLANKWNLTNYEVLKYIASVTGNINLGSGWDAAGLAAADGWKIALGELNKYLAAVGKSNFIAPQNVPPGAPTGGAVSPSLAEARKQIEDATVKLKSFNERMLEKLATTNKIPETSVEQDIRNQLATYLAADTAMRQTFQDLNININNAGSVVSTGDLVQDIRNALIEAGLSGSQTVTNRNVGVFQ